MKPSPKLPQSECVLGTRAPRRVYCLAVNAWRLNSNVKEKDFGFVCLVLFFFLMYK